MTPTDGLMALLREDSDAPQQVGMTPTDGLVALFNAERGTPEASENAEIMRITTQLDRTHAFNKDYELLTFATSNRHDVLNQFLTYFNRTNQAKEAFQQLSQIMRNKSFRDIVKSFDSSLDGIDSDVESYRGHVKLNVRNVDHEFSFLPDLARVLQNHTDESTFIALGKWLKTVSKLPGDNVALYLMKHKRRANAYKLLVLSISNGELRVSSGSSKLWWYLCLLNTNSGTLSRMATTSIENERLGSSSNNPLPQQIRNTESTE